MDDIPPLRHDQPCPNTNFISTDSSASTAARNAAINTTNANTTAVVCSVSLRFGQDTRPASAHASLLKTKNSLPGTDVSATTAATAKPAITISTRSTVARSAK